MSRSIGDRYLKPWTIPELEVMFIPRAREDECLILANDRLWDIISNRKAQASSQGFRSKDAYDGLDSAFDANSRLAVARKRMVHAQFNNLQECYLQK